jgi:hypothetical protein
LRISFLCLSTCPSLLYTQLSRSRTCNMNLELGNSLSSFTRSLGIPSEKQSNVLSNHMLSQFFHRTPWYEARPSEVNNAWSEVVAALAKPTANTFRCFLTPRPFRRRRQPISGVRCVNRTPIDSATRLFKTNRIVRQFAPNPLLTHAQRFLESIKNRRGQHGQLNKDTIFGSRNANSVLAACS